MRLIWCKNNAGALLGDAVVYGSQVLITKGRWRLKGHIVGYRHICHFFYSYSISLVCCLNPAISHVISHLFGYS